MEGIIGVVGLIVILCFIYGIVAGNNDDGRMLIGAILLCSIVGTLFMLAEGTLKEAIIVLFCIIISGVIPFLIIRSYYNWRWNKEMKAFLAENRENRDYMP